MPAVLAVRGHHPDGVDDPLGRAARRLPLPRAAGLRAEPAARQAGGEVVAASATARAQLQLQALRGKVAADIQVGNERPT